MPLTLIRSVLNTRLAIDHYWGDGAIGLALTEATIAGGGAVSADSIAALLPCMSPDTARRRLLRLVDLRLAERRHSDHRHFYRATEESAVQTLRFLNEITSYYRNLQPN